VAGVPNGLRLRSSDSAQNNQSRRVYWRDWLGRQPAGSQSDRRFALLLVTFT
jgi:hypothetical protein